MNKGGTSERSKRRRIHNQVNSFLSECTAGTNLNESDPAIETFQNNHNLKNVDDIVGSDNYTETNITSDYLINLKSGGNCQSNSKDITPGEQVGTRYSGENSGIRTFETQDPDIDINIWENEHKNRFVEQEEDSGEDEETENIESQLAEWATRFHISLTALSALLFILRLHGFKLPKDPRTILSTPLNYTITRFSAGDYHYRGIKTGITSLVNQFSYKMHEDLSLLNLQVNVDGLPLFKSSKLQLWPILGMIKELRHLGPFVIALFVGKSKPPLEEYFEPFVREMGVISDDGLEINEKLFRLKLDAIICDAPARAYIKGIKGHSGYHACERCIQEGDYDGRLFYAVTKDQLRTDESFMNMIDEDHHLKVTPLCHLQCDLVTRCVLDYMHLVCLGVVRKILFFWSSGPLKTRLSSNNLHAISCRLISLVPYIPKVFARKPRSLIEMKMWKATEFRQFVLYTGPVILLGKIKDSWYRNFCLLSMSLRIILTASMYGIEHSYVENLLEVFVKNFSSIYGKEMVSYNVHKLLHIVDDVRIFGSLNNVSCFPFENFLGSLKKLIRKPQNPLPQILRRLNEKSASKSKLFTNNKSVCKHQYQHFLGPLMSGYESCSQYKQYSSELMFLSISCGDNCVCIDDKVCVLKNIYLLSGSTYVAFSMFEKQESFSKYPFDLSLLSIYKVFGISDQILVKPLCAIKHKYVLLPHQTEPDWFVAMPIVHDM